MGALAYNLSTWEEEAGRSEAEGHYSRLHSGLEASLTCMKGLSVKNKSKPKPKQKQNKTKLG